MNDTLILKTSISLSATKAKVWDALTTPDQIKKYFFGTDAVSDWKVGSPLIFKGVWEGKEYEDKGFILELEKDKFFKYSYWSSFSGTDDLPQNYANVSYALLEESGKTILTITQDGIKTKEQLVHSETNWKAILENLKKLLED